MKFKELLHHLKKTEKIVLVFLVLLLAVTGYQVGNAFYLDNTEAEFIKGGVYTEGAVGEVTNLNPLFVQQGSISQDLSELIFSGLSKYDTKKGQIVPDMATSTKSEDGKKYDFVLKDGIKWHDGKLLTADDIIFTYETILKNPEFKGAVLNYNDYSGVKITKVDDRTVQFLLDSPDAFFLAKTTIGILPKHLLETTPIPQLPTAIFNSQPVGSGPYRFVSMVNFPNHIEYGLEVFSEYYDGTPNIKTVLLKVFPTFQELEKNMGQLSGIRNVPPEFIEAVKEKDKFILNDYELPQYVAVFINNEAPKVKEVNVRLGLQLATDKESIIANLKQKKIIDTPLLEINQKNWLNQFSIKKANGALFETEWQIPNKSALEEAGQDLEKVEKEPSPTSEVTNITSPNNGKDWKTSREPITISGKIPENSKGIWIDDYKLQQLKPEDKEWNYVAAKKFDSLKSGKNIYQVYSEDGAGKKTMIDAITIVFEDEGNSTDSGDLERIKKENQEALDLPTRVNKKDEKLVLRLLTSKNPTSYTKVAQLLQAQWKKIGVELQIEVLDSPAFEEKLAKRDYDLLLFGQNLGYNLDAYPYWHSSQAKQSDSEKKDDLPTKEKNGLNLSQFKHFVVDTLLKKARLVDDKARQETLNEIQEIISQEVPAIFLYSPVYYTALSKDINYPEFEHLATTSDRLATIQDWYADANRNFKKGVNFFTFFSWSAKQL